MPQTHHFFPGFKVKTTKSTGSETENIVIRHTKSRRWFNIRVLDGLFSAESVLVPERNDISIKRRFYAEEYIPTGEITNAKCSLVIRLPDFSSQMELPDKAVKFVWQEAKRKTETAKTKYYPAFMGGSYSTSSIFYDSLEAAFHAIKCAIETNMWLSSNEPYRGKVCPVTGIEASLKTWAVIEIHGSQRALQVIIQRMQEFVLPGHKIELCRWFGEFVYIEIHDPSIDGYPEYMRFGATFDCKEKRIKQTPGGICFYRTGYENLAKELLGNKAENYSE